MDWTEVVDNPLLQNLPFKIELNQFGKIVMSPVNNNHGRWKFEVGKIIHNGKRSGEIIMGCSINTLEGVKVADVAWLSDEFIAKHGVVTPYNVAPEICVEIISPSNSKREMEEKITLYLAKGAHEVWLCDQEGVISYFSHEGQIEKSKEVQD